MACTASATTSVNSHSSSRSSVAVDLNGNGVPDRCETISRSHNGVQSGSTTCYVTMLDGTSRKVFELSYPVYSISFPGTRTNGWVDIITKKDAASASYTWRWDGHTYR